MSEVRLEIGGRNYTLTCAEGEEEHVRKLGKLIDDKVRQVNGGKPGAEAQSLLFAALILADELEEARKSQGSTEEFAEILERCATQLENCAASLDGGA